MALENSKTPKALKLLLRMTTLQMSFHIEFLREWSLTVYLRANEGFVTRMAPEVVQEVAPLEEEAAAVLLQAIEKVIPFMGLLILELYEVEILRTGLHTFQFKLIIVYLCSLRDYYL